MIEPDQIKEKGPISTDSSILAEGSIIAEG